MERKENAISVTKEKPPKKKFKKQPKKQEKPDWKEFKAKKKQQKQESRENREYSKASEAVNGVWMIDWANKKPKTRVMKVGEILNGIGQDLKHIIGRKGASKAMLVLIKYGDNAQRSKIVSSLKGHLTKMSKDQNQYILLPHMLKYADKAQKQQIGEELIKDVATLCSNRYACMVLDRILIDPDCKKIKLLALQQIYSKMYITLPELDSEGTPLTLEQIFEKNPNSKVGTMENMAKFLENWLSKSPSLVVVQMVLLRYFQHCNPAEYSAMVDLVFEHVMQLQGTIDGCLAIVEALNYSTAKQRKKILQPFKEHVSAMAVDPESILVLLRAIDVTDDTVLLKKTILVPLMEDLEAACNSQRARLIFLHILDPRAKRYFSNDILKVLPEPILASSKNPRFNCKKDPQNRQKELLKVILKPLTKHLELNVETILDKSSAKEPLLYPVLKHCFGDLVPLKEEGNALLKAIAEHCASHMEIFTNGVSHRRLRGLTELVPQFCEVLLDTLSDKQIQSVAKGLSALVLARCFQKGGDSCKEKLLKVLKPIRSNLSERAADVKNVRILVEELKL